jgi:hypothetical protein
VSLHSYPISPFPLLERAGCYAWCPSFAPSFGANLGSEKYAPGVPHSSFFCFSGVVRLVLR